MASLNRAELELLYKSFKFIYTVSRMPMDRRTQETIMKSAKLGADMIEGVIGQQGRVPASEWQEGMLR